MDLIGLKVKIIKRHLYELSQRSILEIFVVGLAVILIGLGIYWFSLRSLVYIQRVPLLGNLLMDRILYIFLLAFFAMLSFSTTVALFSGLYRSSELALFYSLPLEKGKVFWYKAFDAFVLSMWSSVTLILPIIFAYGRARGFGLPFFFFSFLSLLPLVLLACVFSSFISLVWLRVFAYRKWIARAVFVFIAGSILWRIGHVGLEKKLTDQDPILVFNKMLGHTSFASFPLWPSYWMGKGLLLISGNYPAQGWRYFSLMCSQCLMGFLVMKLLVHFLYQGFQIGGSLAVDPRRSSRSFLIRLIELARFFFPRHLQPFFLKDFKILVRDPVQWSQTMIFFGLLAVYFLNLRTLPYRNIELPLMKSIISCLNLSATLMVLAMLNIRFNFPQLSWDLKRAWIISLGRRSLNGLLQEKFWLTFIAGALVTETLMFLSNWMLKLEVAMAWFSYLVVLLASLGLAGLNVGLGVRFANLKDESPAKIVSGFGGTLLLILSMAYVFLVGLAEGIPVHMSITGAPLQAAARFKFVLTASLTFIIIATVLAWRAPLFLGRKSLEAMEF